MVFASKGATAHLGSQDAHFTFCKYNGKEQSFNRMLYLHAHPKHYIMEVSLLKELPVI